MSPPLGQTMDPLTLSLSVDCSPEHAFAVWTTKASGWWPAGHTVSGERGTAVIFEPRAGEITFTAEGDSTAVSIEHRGWERFGADAERRRAGNRAGWEDVLPTYQRACLEIG